MWGNVCPLFVLTLPSPAFRLASSALQFGLLDLKLLWVLGLGRGGLDLGLGLDNHIVI